VTLVRELNLESQHKVNLQYNKEN